MKLNVQNFLQSDETKADAIWYIKDDDPLVRKASHSLYDFTGQMYHTVKWWAYLRSNGKLILLMYIENPSKKYDFNVWSERRKRFCEIYETLEKENKI